jgi:hypothetical protein
VAELSAELDSMAGWEGGALGVGVSGAAA